MALRIPMLRAPTLRIALPSIARDPGSASLRRGLRAAVIVTLLLGAATLLAVQQSVATFLVFGVMALLVFADFGGTTRARVSAYILAALAGVPLIVVGTLASTSVWIAVGASALVGFVLSGLGVFGGYVLSAQSALMLAFILSVTSVAPVEAMAPRVVGWMVAGGVAALGGVALSARPPPLAPRGPPARGITGGGCPIR